MNKEEISHILEVTHINGGAKPTVIRVMCKQDVTHYGYFFSYPDYVELKERNRFRFILRNSFGAFNDEYIKKGEYSTKYSIILNGDDILHIEFVMPLNT